MEMQLRQISCSMRGSSVYLPDLPANKVMVVIKLDLHPCDRGLRCSEYDEKRGFLCLVG